MQTIRLQELILKRKSLISRLSVIKGEDMNNRVRLYTVCVRMVTVLLQLMSVKDKLLSTTSPATQNPVPQSNDKPLVVVSLPSQSSTKTSKPVTTTISATVKPPAQVSDTVTMANLHQCYMYRLSQSLAVVLLEV